MMSTCTQTALLTTAALKQRAFAVCLNTLCLPFRRDCMHAEGQNLGLKRAHVCLPLLGMQIHDVLGLNGEKAKEQAH